MAAKVIYAKYCNEKEYPKPFKKGSHICQDIGKGWDIFKKYLGWSIGKGDCVSFCYDIWTPFGPLRNNVQGPMTSQKENRTVASSIVNNAWNLEEITLTLPPASLLWIQHLILQTDQEDRLVCSLARGNYFD